MYKLKTKSKLRKCVKITGTGKIIRKKTGKNHMLDKKTTKRKRHLRKQAYCSKANAAVIKKLIPYK